MMKWLVPLAFALPWSAAAQDDLYYFGTVRDHTTRIAIVGAVVTVDVDGVQAVRLQTDSIGRYSFSADLGHTVRVRYDAAGYLGKNVSIDLHGIPDSSAIGGFGMNVDITLFPPVPGVDMRFLEEPIGKAAFSPATHMIEWDPAYTAIVRERILAAMPVLRPADQDTAPASR